MSAKIKLANADQVGAPKTNRASKKNKKSWRKNVDMTQVNEFLEEKRFEERTGGSLENKPDEALFTLDTNVDVAASSRKKRREAKPLKCFALLEGLPGKSKLLFCLCFTCAGQVLRIRYRSETRLTRRRREKTRLLRI